MWGGTYASRDTGHGGSIWFKLIGGDDHAHGDVLMIGEDRRMAFDSTPARDALVRPGRATRRTFRGRLLENRLEATFTTRLASGMEAAGMWSAS